MNRFLASDRYCWRRISTRPAQSASGQEELVGSLLPELWFIGEWRVVECAVFLPTCCKCRFDCCVREKGASYVVRLCLCRRVEQRE